jgi:hypothetical protein
MENPIELETSYKEYMENLSQATPDGILEVDLALLQTYGLLGCEDPPTEGDNTLTHFFHVIEAPEKITLFNDQFVVWIVPQVIDNLSTTFTLVALNTGRKPRLELVFSAAGVYNTSHLVLRILEHILQEIQENEELITKIQRAS